MRLSLLTAAVLLSASLAARADTFTFQFSGTSDANTPLTGSGSLTASADPGSNLYDVSAIGGTIDAIAITGLGSFDSSSSVSNAFFYPQVGGNYFFDDEDGLTFALANGEQLALGNYNGIDVLNDAANTPAYTGTITSITITPVAVAATPEPSSFVLLGTGLLSVVGLTKRRFA